MNKISHRLINIIWLILTNFLFRISKTSHPTNAEASFNYIIEYVWKREYRCTSTISMQQYLCSNDPTDLYDT